MVGRSQEVTLRTGRAIAVYAIAVILLGVLLHAAVVPARQALAKRYAARGDAAFLSLKYEQAEREYQRALRYDSTLQNVQQDLDYVRLATTDIARTRPFFEEHGAMAVLQKIDRATGAYDDPKQALSVGVAFFEAGDVVYARYPIEQAVTLDPQYPEALNYLAQVYEKLAEFDASFRGKAEDAARRRDEITPKYLKGTGAGVE